MNFHHKNLKFIKVDRLVAAATVHLILLATLFGLASCGGGGSSAGGAANTGTVSAQSNQYSLSSLNGTYAFSVIGFTGSLGVFDGSGTITANGSGGITGTVKIYSTSGGTCQESLSGNYNVTSTGSGIANLVFTVSSGSCPGGPTTFDVQVGQSGASALFAESDNLEWAAGTLVKQ